MTHATWCDQDQHDENGAQDCASWMAVVGDACLWLARDDAGNAVMLESRLTRLDAGGVHGLIAQLQRYAELMQTS